MLQIDFSRTRKHWVRVTIIIIFLFNVLIKDALCMQVIKEEDNKKEIIISLNDTVELKLKAIGSAGYKWFLNDFDGRYLELLSEEVSPLTDKVGAPIIYVWRFKAIKEGITTLRLDYYRPWEGLDKKEKDFNINIIIKE